jgi:predicted  nucleic acid-binding Zn-ribbon protein
MNQENRKNALTALDNLLASTTSLKPSLASLDENITATLGDESLKEELSSKFSAVMATLGDASITDSRLSSLVETFNDSTKDFQKLTGEVLETKTITSLFEGVERLKQRTNRITSQILTSEQVRFDKNEYTGMKFI